MTHPLEQAFPTLATHLPRTPLADLPTPVDLTTLSIDGVEQTISIKHDEQTSNLYGGNKVRKLEYLLQRAIDRGAMRVATFGTVASNHALATALHATRLGFECTCLLSHQAKTPNAAIALNMHLVNGTEIVRFGGDRPTRVATMRRYLQGRNTWLIPMGGSNWLGAIGFVNAGLELAAQVVAGAIPEPARLYVANGTMATAAGLAVGLALAGLPTEVHAVRVTDPVIANPEAMRRLIAKTVTLMNRFDAAVPADLASKTRICFRDGFFGEAYARSTPAADEAIQVAREKLGLNLETTYTGKALAALLHDLRQSQLEETSPLFWNTYNARPLPATTRRPDDTSQLPPEFLRYFD